MRGDVITYFENYSPVGDIIVLALVFVIVILIKEAYINKTTGFKIFETMVGSILIAACLGIFYRVELNMLGSCPHAVIYVLRIGYRMALYSNLYLYLGYILVPLQLNWKNALHYHILPTIVYVGLILHEIVTTTFRFGFYIREDNTIHKGVDIFVYGYAFFVLYIVIVVIRNRKRLIKPLYRSILASFGVSVLIMLIQGYFKQISYTTATFMFPVITLLYLVHANPYDLEIGAVNVTAFEDTIEYNRARNNKLLMMSMYMHDFDGTGKKYPVEIQQAIKHFYMDFFKSATLFQITTGRMILVMDTAKNPSYQNIVNDMLKNFEGAYEQFHKDFKIVIAMSDDSITSPIDYVNLIKFMESKMSENDVRYVSDKDVEEYSEYKYILSELEDINVKNDLDDPRVEVYCQPVLNIRNGKYDTAEALMRLNLEQIGMVYPDKFIPIAEDNNYIHVLSKIILHKTCMHIKSMMDCSYIVKRISVNFTVSDVRNESFCKDIDDIIGESGIPYEKIAVEITESQSEADFQLLKKRIDELKGRGIKFYLDDFGTGYSNFERIMELPFDIIKFDRSLVIACASDYKSEKMVYHLAKMFSDMDYSVLYEGVETIEDEEKCKNMCARYLQGYKYSKPIPMEKLTEYFEKVIA